MWVQYVLQNLYGDPVVSSRIMWEAIAMCGSDDHICLVAPEFHLDVCTDALTAKVVAQRALLALPHSLATQLEYFFLELFHLSRLTNRQFSIVLPPDGRNFSTLGSNLRKFPTHANGMCSYDEALFHCFPPNERNFSTVGSSLKDVKRTNVDSDTVAASIGKDTMSVGGDGNADGFGNSDGDEITDIFGNDDDDANPDSARSSHGDGIPDRADNTDKDCIADPDVEGDGDVDGGFRRKKKASKGVPGWRLWNDGAPLRHFYLLLNSCPASIHFSKPLPIEWLPLYFLKTKAQKDSKTRHISLTRIHRESWERWERQYPLPHRQTTNF